MSEQTPAESVAPDADDTDTDEQNPSHEAKKWRTRLRAKETEFAALVAQLEAVQRSQVDAHIEALGLKPAAVWAAGGQLADLLDDDGTVNLDAVKAAVVGAREQLGIPATKPKGPLRSGTMVPQEPRNRFVDAFAPRADKI